MKAIIIFSLISFINACTIVQSYSEIKPGDTLLIKKTLAIPANSARIIIQNGHIVTASQIQTYHPRCWFISRTIKSTPQVILTGQFLISHIRQTFEIVHRNSSGHILASLVTSDATAIEYFTEMSIHSDSQPNINRLICSHWEDPYDPEHLTLAEINNALGQYAVIRSHNF